MNLWLNSFNVLRVGINGESKHAVFEVHVPVIIIVTIIVVVHTQHFQYGEIRSSTGSPDRL